MPKTIVAFGALPGVVFSAPVPKTGSSSIPYSQMRAGSDDTLCLVAPSKIEVEVEHDEGVEQEVIVAMAYRKLLRTLLRATYEEFMLARADIVASQQSEASL